MCAETVVDPHPIKTINQVWQHGCHLHLTMALKPPYQFIQHIIHGRFCDWPFFMFVGLVMVNVGRCGQGSCWWVCWPSCWSVLKVSVGLKQECSSQARFRKTVVSSFAWEIQVSDWNSEEAKSGLTTLMLAILRRASFWLPSMVYISVFITHIHYKLNFFLPRGSIHQSRA